MYRAQVQANNTHIQDTNKSRKKAKPKSKRNRPQDADKDASEDGAFTVPAAAAVKPTLFLGPTKEEEQQQQ